MDISSVEGGRGKGQVIMVFWLVFFFYENQAHVPHVVGLLKPLQGSHPYFLPEILQVVGLSMPKEQLQKYFLLLFYL